VCVNSKNQHYHTQEKNWHLHDLNSLAHSGLTT